jgi:hypothetical protein
MDVGSDVRAVADVGRPDAVSIRDTGQEPTHTVRVEPSPGVGTTSIRGVIRLRQGTVPRGVAALARR